MLQPRLAFEAVTVPVSGRTPSAKHASYSGAVCATRRRGALALTYRDKLIKHGTLTDWEAAAECNVQLSSICSTRQGWGGHVVPSGEFHATAFGTLRTRWMWREDLP